MAREASSSAIGGCSYGEGQTVLTEVYSNAEVVTGSFAVDVRTFLNPAITPPPANS